MDEQPARVLSMCLQVVLPCTVHVDTTCSLVVVMVVVEIIIEMARRRGCSKTREGRQPAFFPEVVPEGED